MTTSTTVQIGEGIELKVDSNGAQQWFKDGKLHREGDQPACIWADGTKKWFKEGKLHREGDQPAIVRSNGKKYWYKGGKLHREGDQPAIIYSDGTKEWWKEGKLHREGDQPAFICADGTKKWYKEGVEYTPSVKSVEEKKLTDESVFDENKRLKEEVARLKKMIVELVRA